MTREKDVVGLESRTGQGSCSANMRTTDCLSNLRRKLPTTAVTVGVKAGRVGAQANLVSSTFDDAMTTDALSTWPNQTMPFLSIAHLNLEENDQFFVIQVQVERPFTLFLVGIVVPCILMIILTMFTFVGVDNYNKLGIAFTTLLMMAVYADQVKSSTPSHVQYLTWIDVFILSNLIFNVIATATACLMILFEETDHDEVWFGLDLTEAFGKAICYTQIPFVILLNVIMVAVGQSEGSKSASVMNGNNLLALALCLNLASVLVLVLCTWYVAQRTTNDEGDKVTEPPAVSERAHQPSSPPAPAVETTSRLVYAAPPTSFAMPGNRILSGYP